MIKNAKVKNLENIILNVVTRDNSELDLSSINMKSSWSNNILKTVASEANSLILIGGKNSQELMDGLNTKCLVKVINSNDKNIEEFKSLDKTKFEVLYTDTYDLCTDPDLIDRYLKDHPANDLYGYRMLESNIQEQRKSKPLIGDNYFDTAILDADINLLEISMFKKTIEESFRVLSKGGKILIRMILADEPCNDLLPISINKHMLQTIPLEKEIIDIIEQIGFHGMKFEWRSDLPISVIKGIELREFVISAYKGKQGPCMDRGQAVIYRGPWKEVVDDDGHHFKRGERAAVCSKTYDVMNKMPYEGQFIYVPCYINITEESASFFDCNTPKIREIRVTKGIIGVNESKDESACTSSCDC